MTTGRNGLWSCGMTRRVKGARNREVYGGGCCTGLAIPT